ncbi:hypothetical protein BwSH20_22560 [Bradyrhizobium ottawaense]|nr:hypothetical protein BwSF12_10220 [Bradyrhizobium ottawaense]GMO56994.1 hypothetical protein BwSG20_07290 [Bradyrhizobium ottawaense]GMO98599.1 hypothetical protein BwSH20_22560 [Bradyrhizobium ottawaense]
MLHGFDDAAAGGEFDGEVLDVEQRLGGHAGLRTKKRENNPMHSRMGLKSLENFGRVFAREACTGLSLPLPVLTGRGLG